MLNNSREQGKNPKPTKKHREGYTGRRKMLDKEKKIALKEKKPDKETFKRPHWSPVNLFDKENQARLSEFKKDFMFRFKLKSEPEKIEDGHDEYDSEYYDD